MIKTTHTPPSLLLSEPQRRLVRAAVARADGAIVLPDRLKGKAAERVVAALLGKGLVREIRTKASLPAWRQEGGTGRRFSLVLTKAGRAALADAVEAVGSATPATAIASENTGAVLPSTKPVLLPAAKLHSAQPSPAPSSALPLSPRAGSKLCDVIELLGRDAGTTVAELMDATGWLPHTTRAALTGLRKRGYPVMREPAADGSGSLYRIEPLAAAAA